MTNIENHLKQLRLIGMSHRWEALMETRQHHELSLSDGLEDTLAERRGRSSKQTF